MMKALTIKQPLVHAILHEGKDIENRSWQRNFRGWLAGQPDHSARFPQGHSVPIWKACTVLPFVELPEL